VVIHLRSADRVEWKGRDPPQQDQQYYSIPQGRPILLLLSEGQMSDHTGAAMIFPVLPDADVLIGDKGYDGDAFRTALIERKITPCIPPGAKRRSPATYCKALYKRRHNVENMFAKLKDWRRISTRYDRCAQRAPSLQFLALELCQGTQRAPNVRFQALLVR
jgi:putative transposase